MTSAWDRYQQIDQLEEEERHARIHVLECFKFSSHIFAALVLFHEETELHLKKMLEMVTTLHNNIKKDGQPLPWQYPRTLEEWAKLQSELEQQKRLDYRYQIFCSAIDHYSTLNGSFSWSSENLMSGLRIIYSRLRDYEKSLEQLINNRKDLTTS